MSFDIYLYALTSFFVIMDPIGVSPIYAALTRDETPAAARVMAFKGVAAAFLLLVLFGLFGEVVLTRLGISIDAFRIAGGVFLFTTAFQMVTSVPTPSRVAAGEKSKESESDADYAFYPLAIPLLAGPGSLTTMILLMSEVTASGDPVMNQMQLFAALISVLIIAIFCLLFAMTITRMLGRGGTALFTRVLGILLAALSIQFVIDGLQNIFLG